MTHECLFYIDFVILYIFFISSTPVITAVSPVPLPTFWGPSTCQFLSTLIRLRHSVYPLAQTLGHVVHLLVGFLVHCCCHGLYVFSSHLSALFQRGALRAHFQVGLCLNHVLILRYFICSLHQSGSNRKTQSFISFQSPGNLTQGISYTVDGRAEKSKWKNAATQRWSTGRYGRDQG